MTSSIASPRIALVGNPNCGKTALFNRLTGARQKVANYAGVTIERKEGKFTSPSGRHWQVLDLPGTYSLHAITPDEKITEEVVTGSAPMKRCRMRCCAWWMRATSSAAYVWCLN